jgi:glutathione synthase/RimK-type ligase-like ATP-grasp enzyme
MGIVLILHYMVNKGGKTPFENDDFDDSYASLSYYSRHKDITVYVANESSYDNGECNEAWIHDGISWSKKTSIVPDLLFLKITPSKMGDYIIDAKKNKIKIINNPELDAILNDKMRTHSLFSDISPPSLQSEKNDIIKVINVLRKSDLHDDLDSSHIFMKPLSLSGGEGIRVITDYPDIEKIGKGPFLLQPRIMTNKTFLSFNILGNYDCRIVMHNENIVHCYLRISDEEITNAALGGKIFYIPLEQIPTNVYDTIKMIDKKIESYGNRIYTIDFALGISGRFWLIEMNAQPGIAWNSNNDQKVREAKILHQHYANYFKESLV